SGEQLVEVLGAVLDNAREAISGPGRVTLTARARALAHADCLDLLGNPSPGTFVEVEVTDSGNGLSPDARDRLFREPFFTNKVRHRGLGLLVAYGVLCVHRGGLCLESPPGQGVRVRLYLPVAADDSPEVPARLAATSAPAAATGPTNEKI